MEILETLGLHQPHGFLGIHGPEGPEQVRHDLADWKTMGSRLEIVHFTGGVAHEGEMYNLKM
jgi:hypothetical protein